MGTINLNGNLVAGPAGASAFPGGAGSYSLATSPDPKPFSVTAQGVKQLNSPSAYQTLPGVGAGSDVTGADFVYIKANAPVLVRLTQAGLGSPAIVQVQGMLIMEFPANALCTLIEVEGSATVEYLATGQS